MFLRITTLLALSVASLLAAENNLKWTALPDLPGGLGVAGPFVGVHNDALIIGGGGHFPVGGAGGPAPGGGGLGGGYYGTAVVGAGGGGGGSGGRGQGERRLGSG